MSIKEELDIGDLIEWTAKTDPNISDLGWVVVKEKRRRGFHYEVHWISDGEVSEFKSWKIHDAPVKLIQKVLKD